MTYNFSELKSDGRTKNEYRVIELDKKTFFNRHLRYQALDIIHEMTHHEKHEPRASDHQFISPFITGLNALLDVIERQKEENYSLSDSEYEKIVTMQNMMENIFGKYGFNKDYEFYVYRNGGGVLELRISDRTYSQKGNTESEQAANLLRAQNKKLRALGNIIDALSTVQFEISVHESGYSFFGDTKMLDKMPKGSITLDHVKNNKILNSMIHVGIWNKSCARNTFKNIQRPSMFEKNIPVDEVDYEKPERMGDSTRPPEWQFKKTYYVDCQGDDNTVKDITSDQKVTVTGNNNLVEKIGSSIYISIEGNDNTLSNINLPESVSREYSIADAYGNLFNATLVRVKGNNNQIVDSEPVSEIDLLDVSDSHIEHVSGLFISIFESKSVYISNFDVDGQSWYGLSTGYGLEHKKNVFHRVTPSLHISESQDVVFKNVRVYLGNQAEWAGQQTGNAYSEAEGIHFKIEKSSFYAKNLAIDNRPIEIAGKYSLTSPIGRAIFRAPISITNATVRLQDLCAQKSPTKAMECKDMKAFTDRQVEKEMLAEKL